jgi:subtilase family serine protease
MTPLVVKVEQIESYDSPGELPDLAIAPWEAVFQDGKIIVTIHNIGNKEAESIKVNLLDKEQTLEEKTISHIDNPTDFVAKRSQVIFEDISFSRNLKIVINPENDIREILEENNNAAVGKPVDYKEAKNATRESPPE